jgi:hypothetical protein
MTKRTRMIDKEPDCPKCGAQLIERKVSGERSHLACSEDCGFRTPDLAEMWHLLGYFGKLQAAMQALNELCAIETENQSVVIQRGRDLDE